MSALHFCSGLGHQHSKGADGSHYQSIYEPTEPSQPMMSADVSEQRYTTTTGTMSPTYSLHCISAVGSDINILRVLMAAAISPFISLLSPPNP